VIGTVVRLTPADGLTLEGGLAAPVAEAVRVTGAQDLQQVAPGDLVEIVRDANGLVTDLHRLPRLAQRVPLVEVASPHVPLSRFWWTHDGQDFPDSLYAADAAIPLQVPAIALEATVAYLPQEGADAVEFAVLDEAGVVLWSQRVPAGGVVALRSTLQGGTLVLRCRRADGAVPDHTHCIWGSPTVLLREPGLFPLRPAVTADLAAKLDAVLKNVDPGPLGIAQPKIVGCSPQMARDLQQDLFTALGARHPVVGLMPWEAGADLTEAQRQAAQAATVTSVAVSELRYSPEGSVVKLALVHAAAREILATAETTIKP